MLDFFYNREVNDTLSFFQRVYTLINPSLKIYFKHVNCIKTKSSKKYLAGVILAYSFSF